MGDAILRVWGYIDTAFIRLGAVKLLGRSPSIFIRNKLNKIAFKTLLSNPGQLLTQLKAGPKIWVNRNDQAAASLIFQGQKNDDVSKKLIELSDLSASFIDVGANYGYFSLVIAHRHPDMPIAAVEPNPNLASLIEKSLAANRSSNVRLWVAACGAEPGRATLSFSGRSSGTGSIATKAGGSTVDVDVVVIDKIAAEMPKRTLVKIDVEGFEVEALSGAAALLSGQPIIVCELSLKTLAGVKDICRTHGLEVFGFDYCLMDEATFRFGRKNVDALICNRADIDLIRDHLSNKS